MTATGTIEKESDRVWSRSGSGKMEGQRFKQTDLTTRVSDIELRFEGTRHEVEDEERGSTEPLTWNSTWIRKEKK